MVRHRGPDGEGHALFAGSAMWRIDGPDTPPGARISPELSSPDLGELALGHRRLAIVDPGPAGHQPMGSPDGRYWLTYNGEIYNHPELRETLRKAGWAFRSASDTEVVLAAYAHWGEACLDRFNGMFAFVLYDRAERRVFIARDRFGVKPLYLWRAPDRTLAIASEIKQFTTLPGWRAQADGQRVYDYLNWGITDHTAGTMFAGVSQLPAGACIAATLTDLSAAVAQRIWYRPPAESGPVQRPETAIAEWHGLFMDSVRLRLRADVPVGTALSGGLDSSAIVCAVHALLRDDPSAPPRNAFSARSHDSRFDEGPFMNAVVAHTGVRHHVVWPDADRLAEDRMNLTWHLDEPFGSTSVFAAWCVFAAVAATPVKVTLDGHGADEILGGYAACAGPYLADLARRGHLLSLFREGTALARSGRHGPGMLAASALDDLASPWLRDRLRRIGGRTTGDPDWLDLAQLGARPDDPYGESGGRGSGLRGLALSHLRHTSMPMQLRWNDRTSMAHSIESRTPFLDYRLVEASLRLRDNLKLANGESKVVMRRALASLLPEKIVQRKDKMGFTTAEQVWVRQDRPARFRDWAKQAIAQSGGILTPAAAQRADQMIDGQRPYHASLWRMIAFGAWRDRFDVALPAKAV